MNRISNTVATEVVEATKQVARQRDGFAAEEEGITRFIFNFNSANETLIWI